MFPTKAARQRVFHLSIRYKLAAIVAAGIIAISAIGYVLQLTSQEKLIRDISAQHSTLVIAVLSQQMASPMQFRDINRLKDTIRPMTDNDDSVQAIDVYHEDGELLVTFDREGTRTAHLKDRMNGMFKRHHSDGQIGLEVIDGAMITSEPIFAKSGGSKIGTLIMSWDLAAFHSEMLSRTLKVIAMSAAVSLVVLLGVIWTSGRLVTGPIQALNSAMRRIADREYDTEIGVSARADEIGAMAKQLTELRDQLAEDFQRQGIREKEIAQQEILFQRLVDGLSDLADGRVDQLINLPDMGELDAQQKAVCESFNAVCDKLQNVLSTITSTAVNVRNSAAEIADVAVDQSKRSEAQAVTLEESAAAIETLSSSVEQTAVRAAEANERILLNRKQAQSGDEVVSLAVDAMKNIEQSSEQITAIIGVIDDIAFQTNLLALNAGVEAARAGEAGRGFAVVASEVRALAQRASESANEIKELILRSGEQVANGSELVNKAGSALSEIIDGVHYASDLVSMIATSSREQANNLAEIKDGVSELDRVTQQNAAVIEESSAASRSLSEEAARMTEVMAVFSTEGGKSATAAQAWDDDLAAEQAEAKQTQPGTGASEQKGKIVFESRARAERTAVNQSENWQDF